jgi:hypothetical protein
MSDFFVLTKDPEKLLDKASVLYEDLITKTKSQRDNIEIIKKRYRRLPAREVWEVGNIIFEFIEELASLSLQINGLYDHLERDLNAKRKWLEKVIIFRRYLPNIELVPEELNWGQCEHGTKRVAESLTKNNK